MPLRRRDFVEFAPEEFVDITMLCAMSVDRERNTAIVIDGDIEEVLDMGFRVADDQETDRKMVLRRQLKNVESNLRLIIIALALI